MGYNMRLPWIVPSPSQIKNVIDVVFLKMIAALIWTTQQLKKPLFERQWFMVNFGHVG